jgi:hypothetical protein
MFYEWQIVPNDYAGRTITSIIRNRECAALFVLLGRNLQRPPTSTPQFTHNWVSFEVGIAAGIGKPIWVFEEYNTEIKFPVPYVTDYGQYQIGRVEYLRYYSNLFGNLFLLNHRIAPPGVFNCPYEDCNAVYRYWSQLERFNCPVCRRPIPKQPVFTRPLHFPSNVI